MKTCNVCKVPKTEEEFTIDKSRPTGRTNRCKKCSAKAANIWHHKNRTRHNKRMRTWRNANRKLHPEQFLWTSAKRRAKESNRPFTITKKDIIVPEVCPVFGVPFEFGLSSYSPYAPSLDAIVPELGYVPGNIAVISHKANTMKSNATLEELSKVIAWLKSKET